MTDKIQYNDINHDIIYRNLAKLMALLHVNYDEFYKTLRSYYAFEVYNQGNTIIRTALKCGIDRRFITDIVKQKRKYIKPTTLSLIVKHIEKIARNNNQIVNRYGKQSIRSIMQKIVPGATTVNTIIQELSYLGYIKNMGDYILYINKPYKPLADKELTILATEFERYVNDFVQNHQVNDLPLVK